MKKGLRFLPFFLIMIIAGCSAQIPKGNTGTVNTSAAESACDPATALSEPAPVTSVLSHIGQPGPLYKIDMVTMESGYAITKDFHILNTSDGGKSWTDLLTLGKPFDYSGEPALFALDDKTVYVASYTASGIEVAKSMDDGKTWSKSAINKQGDDFNSGYGGRLLLSFVNSSDGFLLASTPPALGQMGKALYRTSDGGNSWSFMDEGLNQGHGDGVRAGILGYTSGMAFTNTNTGFITCTYHGQSEISIYKTADSGKNWSFASFPLPAEYAPFAYSDDYYVDAYPVVFFDEDNKGAKMELYFCREEERNAYIYSSDDSGSAWHVDGISNLLMTKYCFVDDKSGFGIDDNGALFVTKDGGITWAGVS